MPPFRLLIAMAVAAAASSACREAPLLAPEPGTESGVVLGAVRAEIVEGDSEADGSQTLIVRLRSRNVGLSAYQGVLTFKPGAVDVLSIVPPERPGESYLFNKEHIEEGRLRFAALSLTTFADGFVDGSIEAFRVTVRPRRPLADVGLDATIDVAGVENGVPLTPDQLLPSRLVRRGPEVRRK